MSVSTSSDDAHSTAPAAGFDLRRVAELLRLANRLHGLPQDPVERKRALLDGLIKLVGARAGVCVVVHDDGEQPVLLSSVHLHNGSSRGATRGASVIDGHADPMVQQALGHLFPRTSYKTLAPRGKRIARVGANPAATTPTLMSSTPLERAGTQAVVALSRGRGARDAFTPIDQSLVDLVHAEMRWVYALDLPLASPEVLSLSPRTKETLQLLLAGNGEKQIAQHLKLSLNTVHHYVKQLYRHFGVSSRSELLARWLRKESKP